MTLNEQTARVCGWLSDPAPDAEHDLSIAMQAYEHVWKLGWWMIATHVATMGWSVQLSKPDASVDGYGDSLAAALCCAVVATQNK